MNFYTYLHHLAVHTGSYCSRNLTNKNPYLVIVVWKLKIEEKKFERIHLPFCKTNMNKPKVINNVPINNVSLNTNMTSSTAKICQLGGTFLALSLANDQHNKTHKIGYNGFKHRISEIYPFITKNLPRCVIVLFWIKAYQPMLGHCRLNY